MVRVNLVSWLSGGQFRCAHTQNGQLLILIRCIAENKRRFCGARCLQVEV